ncbi:MAG: SET domain-containing protein-lysine N-methyltransferase [Saprospiraceae bacterium]|nr:SET domain-containing protein-lysine N-methyltransferase [Saprospiraceae bacterium]
MALQHVPGLYYGPSEIHGRGVFCAVDVQAGDVLEICPVVVLDLDENQWLQRSRLFEYYFIWAGGKPAITLGFGSLYNHAEAPNADFIPDYGSDLIVFVALEMIPAGKEITIDYQAGAKKRELWFVPK